MADDLNENDLTPEALMMLLAVICRDAALLKARVEELERRVDAMTAASRADHP